MNRTTESLINESVKKEELCENNDNVNSEPNISNESIEIKEENIKLELDSDTFSDEQDSNTEQSPSKLVEFVEILDVKTEQVDEYVKEEDPIKITEDQEFKIEIEEVDMKKETDISDGTDERECLTSASNNQGTFTCNYCMMAFTTSVHCQKHIRICRDRVYNQPSTSATSIPDKKPRLSNDGDKLFQCNECDNKYKSLNGLYVHLRRHRRAGLHTCRECHKQFTTPSELARHQLIHTGEKPHKCTQCEAAFNRTSSLKLHMFTHTGARPHKCTQCGQSFTISCNLKAHMRTHAGERPYQGTHCSKAFTDSSNLTKHMRTHSGHKPYRCTVCSQAFAQSNGLKYHMKTHSKKTSNKP